MEPAREVLLGLQIVCLLKYVHFITSYRRMHTCRPDADGDKLLTAPSASRSSVLNAPFLVCAATAASTYVCTTELGKGSFESQIIKPDAWIQHVGVLLPVNECA